MSNLSYCPPESRMEGKVAIITGAASGMGAACAQRFAAEGANIVMTDVNMAAGQEGAAKLGPRAVFIRQDIAQQDSWARVVAEAEDHFGPVNVLFNNAGAHTPGFIEQSDPDNWARAISVNLEGTLWGIRTVVPSMKRAGGGSIVNVSSLQGREADIGLVPYVAAKFGVRGLTKSAAIELGRYGIRVNAIFPGLVRTGMTGATPQHLLGKIPLRRAGTDDRAGIAEDVAALVTFLCSDRAGYITGAEVVIDGGKSVRFPNRLQDYRSEVMQFESNAGGN
ncbi:3alpha(or 20beta)-hydroxysteroid dehydrogenase [Mycobacterium sp. MAA66]|uniref:SDR family NAD(P)-dependent oxidoreductase n=1 Tax=Mycobacterium sp. MAA66 TaxID=3156297 RepID=UPI0035156521